MKKTTIKFYSGLDTIGAVIMEIKYGNDRAFFEAGTAFNPAFNMFEDNKVEKRKKNIIKDYLWVNELPKIDYIYPIEYIQDLDLKPASEYKGKQAFFITHLHLDHMKMMGFIDSSIPVYLAKPAQIIEYAQEDLGIGVENLRGLNFTECKDDMQVGDYIKIHRYILNDDSYQDYSFYIETPDLKLHYTGDIFVYGKYFSNIQNEIASINQKDIDILVPEGTTFWSDIPEDIEVTPTFTPKNLLTKTQMDNRLIELIQEYSGLVLFNIYEREMSDVLDIEAYAKQTNRTLVYEPYSAYIINHFFNRQVKCYIPDVYQNEPDYLKYVISHNEIINKQLIIDNPCQYLVQTSYENLLEILDYRNIKTLYLHISGTPIGSFDPKHQRMKNLIDNLHFDYHTRSNYEDDMYFSNHATREQLLSYLDAVKAKLIIPLHTANRKVYCKHIQKPYYWANLNETYIYDKENNTLKVVNEDE